MSHNIVTPFTAKLTGFYITWSRKWPASLATDDRSDRISGLNEQNKSTSLHFYKLNHNKSTMEAKLIYPEYKCRRRFEHVSTPGAGRHIWYFGLHLLRHLSFTVIGRFFTKLLNLKPCAQTIDWFCTRLLFTGHHSFFRRK